MGQLAYIGVGSNLGASARTVEEAMVALASLPGCRWLRASSLWHSKPLADMLQPDYVNAVAVIETDLHAEALLDRLQAIENQFGRTRGAHWASRTLDLDILLFGHIILNSARLTVPHPGLAERDFVLVPLAELDSTLVVPGLGALQELLAQCPQRGLRRISERPIGQMEDR